MAESLGIEALDSERGAAALVIKTIDDVAFPAPFNSMEFDAGNEPKRVYAAAARAKVETTDGDVNVAGNQRSGKGYLGEKEDENLVHYHDLGNFFSSSIICLCQKRFWVIKFTLTKIKTICWSTSTINALV
jgi:hypothetical protein